MRGTVVDSIRRNSIFAWLAAATCMVLLIPLVAMQFTSEVKWGILDFIAMGALLFGSGSVFVLAARSTPRKHWPAIGATVSVAFFYAWAELAVGVFFGVGS